MNTTILLSLTSSAALLLIFFVTQVNTSSVIKSVPPTPTTSELVDTNKPTSILGSTALVPNNIPDQVLPDLFLVPSGWNEKGIAATSSLTESNFSPESTLLVSTSDGHIHGLDSTTGKSIWTTSTGDFLTKASNQFDSDTSRSLFIPGFSGDLFSLDSSRGLTKLPLSIKQIVHSSPMSFGDSTLFIGDKKTRLFRLSIPNGELSPILFGELESDGVILPTLKSKNTSRDVLLGRTDYVVHILPDNLLDAPLNVSYSDIYVSSIKDNTVEGGEKPPPNDIGTSPPFFFHASISGLLSTFTFSSNKNQNNDEETSPSASLKHLWDFNFQSPISGVSLYDPISSSLFHYSIHPSLPDIDSDSSKSKPLSLNENAYIVPGTLESSGHSQNSIMTHSFVLDPSSKPASLAIPTLSEKIVKDNPNFYDYSLLSPSFRSHRVPLAFDSISGYYSVTPYSPPLLASLDSKSNSSRHISGFDSTWEILPFITLLQFLAYLPSLAIVFALGIWIYFSQKASSKIDSKLTIKSPPSIQDLLHQKIFSDDGSITFPHHNITLFPDKILGYGSNGTVVYSGLFQERPVAIKRMLKQFGKFANREIQTLLSLDSLPFVIHYFAKIEDDEFIYLVLEKYDYTFSSIFNARDFSSSSSTLSGATTSSSSSSSENSNLLKAQRQTLTDSSTDDADADSNDQFLQAISNHKIQILHNIVKGVASLHENNILHRDLKPHNMLLKPDSNSPINVPKITIGDLGVAKALSSLSRSQNRAFAQTGVTQSAGTSGWESPEIIRWRENFENLPSTLTTLNPPFTKESDAFSLGCSLYYIYTNGKHPFKDQNSSWRTVEGNILAGHPCFDESIFSSDLLFADLIHGLLSHNPDHRYTVKNAVVHPFFWNGKRRLEFLLACSDMLEFLPANHLLVNQFQQFSATDIIPSQGWFTLIDSEIISNISRYRSYDQNGVRDLLRVIRNKHHHFRELSPRLRILLGNGSEKYYFEYFNALFPNLLILSWKFFWVMCPSEPLGFANELVDTDNPPPQLVDHVTKKSLIKWSRGTGSENTNNKSKNTRQRSPRSTPSSKTRNNGNTKSKFPQSDLDIDQNKNSERDRSTTLNLNTTKNTTHSQGHSLYVKAQEKSWKRGSGATTFVNK